MRPSLQDLDFLVRICVALQQLREPCTHSTDLRLNPVLRSRPALLERPKRYAHVRQGCVMAKELALLFLWKRSHRALLGALHQA